MIRKKHFKKRMVEHQTSHLQPRIAQNPQQQIQYITYVPTPTNNECNLENMHQTNSVQETHQYRPQHQVQHRNLEVLKIQHYEAPMLLNAWTQTHNEDFPSPTAKEIELQTQIEQLKDLLAIQSDELNQINQQQQPKARSPSPARIVTQTINSESEEEIEYRIIKQLNGPDNATQIEIEITDDDDENEKEKGEEMLKNMYAQIEKSQIRIVKAKTPKTPIAPKADPPKTAIASKGPLVSIGPNGTKVPAAEFEKLSWSSASIATRKLLGFIFDRETLATHSMTGKASPAFKDLDKPIKRKLDSNAVEDIIFAVSKKCGVSAKEVRSVITTKCADENKMLKLKSLKNIDTRRSILKDANNKKIKK